MSKAKLDLPEPERPVMTSNQTAKKLGVSFYEYVFDRVSGAFKLPSLADLITRKDQTLMI